MDNIDELITNILTRMSEIDSYITTDGYDTRRKNDPPRPPDGDDYNLLWDAILDEIKQIRPDFNIGVELQRLAKDKE